MVAVPQGTRMAGGGLYPSGCPYCAGKQAWPGENDLASQRPDLLDQWHPTKNLPMTPERVTVGGHFKAWWVCEQGHEWQAIVKSRTLGGCGCPVCADRVLLQGINDLATTHEKRRSDTPGCGSWKFPQSLVAVYQRARVAGQNFLPDLWRGGLSCLRGEIGGGRGKQSGKPVPRRCRPMAPHPQRGPHPGAGDGGEPPNRMVDVSQWAHLESHRLFQSGAAEMRLPRLRRKSPPGAAGTLPSGAGGGGSKTGRSANSRPERKT